MIAAHTHYKVDGFFGELEEFKLLTNILKMNRRLSKWKLMQLSTPTKNL